MKLTNMIWNRFPIMKNKQIWARRRHDLIGVSLAWQSIVIIGLLLLASPSLHAAISVGLANLRCEYLANPLGIDATTPQF